MSDQSARYPVQPRDVDSDSRFTVGLMLRVAAVLEEHGYPPMECGSDMVRLQQALFWFCYRTDDESSRR